MRIVLRARIIYVCYTFGMSHRDTDLALIEPGLVKLSDGFVGVSSILENADDCGTC